MPLPPPWRLSSRQSRMPCARPSTPWSGVSTRDVFSPEWSRTLHDTCKMWLVSQRVPHGHWHTTTSLTCHGAHSPSTTAAARPTTQPAKRCRRGRSVSHTAAYRARGRNSYGGAHTNPSPMPTGVGGSSGSGYFGLKPKWSKDASRLGLRFFYSVGCVYTISGSRLTRVAGFASRAGPLWAHGRRGLQGHPFRFKLRCPHFGA